MYRKLKKYLSYGHIFIKYAVDFHDVFIIHGGSCVSDHNLRYVDARRV